MSTKTTKQEYKNDLDEIFSRIDFEEYEFVIDDEVVSGYDFKKEILNRINQYDDNDALMECIKKKHPVIDDGMKFVIRKKVEQKEKEVEYETYDK